MTVPFLLRVLALVCFILAALGTVALPSGAGWTVGLVPLGLAFWVGSTFP